MNSMLSFDSMLEILELWLKSKSPDEASSNLYFYLHAINLLRQI